MRNIYCWWLSGSEPVERDNNEESMRARDPNHRIPNWEFLDDDEFQALTVNQVIEILLKFLETRDAKAKFFQVMPQRQRGGTDSEDDQGEVGKKTKRERTNLR
ncbi:hypothetical protein AAG906_040958 [Vitis piasezkii]